MRFKKTRAGLVEFAKILEQAPAKLRQRIISDVGKSDPVFMRDALKKVVYFEELVYLDETITSEILSHVNERVLAYAFTGMDQEFIDKIISLLGYGKQRKLRDEQESLTKRPSENMVLGARMQILKIARDLETKNKFVFELVDCPRFKIKHRQHLRLVTRK